MSKPIMVMTGGFSGRIYAVRRYTERGPGLFVVGTPTDSKTDVTDQAIKAVFEHMAMCSDATCLCQTIRSVGSDITVTPTADAGGQNSI